MARVDPPERPPLMALLDWAARVLHDRFLEELAAAGHPQSLSASRLMGTLTADGLRVSELADRLGITKQSVSQLVDDLEADGYVMRIADPTDGRAKLVVFGPRGRDALPAAWRALQASEDHARGILGEDAVGELRAALELLLGHDRAR
jgi:DNA-binding MarR family transcriptional regulator